jgi:hypothetical protein
MMTPNTASAVAGRIDWLSPKIGRLLFLAALASASAIIGPLVFGHHPRPFPADFNHLWAAGKAWTLWQSPYGPGHAAIFDAYNLIHTHNAPPPFFYPPHSIALFAPLGLLPHGAASFVFAALNVAALALSSVIAADLLRHDGLKISRLALASLHAIAIVVFWNAGCVIFAHNIATLFIYIGVLLVLRGVQTDRQASIAGGVFLALISPQIAAVLAFSLLLLKQTRAGALAGGALVAAFSILGLAPGGVAASLGAFLENLSVYASYPENAHSNQSGVGFFVEKIAGPSLSAPLLLICAAATVLIVRSRVREADARAPFEFAAFSLIVGLFFLPSLNHYYVVLTPIAAGYVMKSARMSLVAFAALAIHMRAWDLIAAFDFLFWFQDRNNSATFDSFAILMMLTAAAALSPSLRLSPSTRRNASISAQPTPKSIERGKDRLLGVDTR